MSDIGYTMLSGRVCFRCHLEYETPNALVEFALLRSDGEQIYNPHSAFPLFEQSNKTRVFKRMDKNETVRSFPRPCRYCDNQTKQGERARIHIQKSVFHTAECGLQQPYPSVEADQRGF
jgi:hypothetical protein